MMNKIMKDTSVDSFKGKTMTIYTIYNRMTGVEITQRAS